MKKTIQLILGVIAILGIIGIAKNSLFTDSNTEFYEKGWDAFEKKNYDAAIIFFKWVNKEKYPDVSIYLGASYLEIEDWDNAILNFEEAYKNKIYKNEEEQGKIANSLGISYIETHKYRKARFFLEQSKKLNNPNSTRNLQILDSLEQLQNKNLNTSK